MKREVITTFRFIVFAVQPMQTNSTPSVSPNRLT